MCSSLILHFAHYKLSPTRPRSRASELIVGTQSQLKLSKTELVSILKLSTIWNMKFVRELVSPSADSDLSHIVRHDTKYQLRNFAIATLSNKSTSNWTAAEKIQVARAHKVSTWFKEGLEALVSGQEKVTRADLKTLGEDTTARILLLKEQARVTNANHGATDYVLCAECRDRVSYGSVYFSNMNNRYVEKRPAKAPNVVAADTGTANTTCQKLVETEFKEEIAALKMD